MAEVGSWERDQEVFAIAAKAAGDFRRDYPSIDNLEVRALIQAVGAVWPHIEADSREKAARAIEGRAELLTKRACEERDDYLCDDEADALLDVARSLRDAASIARGVL